jgi:hypothetical protein
VGSHSLSWLQTDFPDADMVGFAQSSTPHVSVERVVHEILANLVRPGVEAFRLSVSLPAADL